MFSLKGNQLVLWANGDVETSKGKLQQTLVTKRDLANIRKSMNILTIFYWGSILE